jgi:UV DNA damage endonuclease
MIRLGYACINTELQAEKPRVTCNRGMIKRTFKSKGLPYTSQLTLQNIQDLKRHIIWNHQHGIEVFRITSCLIPWGSEFQMESLPDFADIANELADAGKLARQFGQRLSFHPGPFNILTSPREHVVQNCYKDLEVHGKIFDLMGMPRDHWSKINIHIGASYGDRPSALDRWCQNFHGLSDAVKSRLTVENDDKANLYSTKMLYDSVHKRLGIPLVFDSHHFTLGPQDSTYQEAIDMAVSTWPTDIRPTCHHSNSKKKYEDHTAPPPAHSKWYYEPFVDGGHDVDVVLECKMKEQALFKYLKDWPLEKREAA